MPATSQSADPVAAEVAPLFEPFRIGRTTLRNRFVMAAMTRAKSPGGIPTDQVRRYYESRAAGGVGLLITEGVYIDHPSAGAQAGVPVLFGPALAAWRGIVDAVHARGGRIMPQIWHTGDVRRRGSGDNPDAPAIGPSAVIEDGVEVVSAATPADIEEIVASYGRAAATAEELGFDGVEVHGAHGYLIDQFLWSGSNRRTDAFGGALENRIRFAEMVVRRVRASVTADFPVVFRFSQWKATDYEARIAETPEELAQILERLSAAGVDAFDVSTRRFWVPAFEGSELSLAAWTRRITGKPVIAVGGVGLNKPHESRFKRTATTRFAEPTDISNAVSGIRAGDFDLIAAGRALLADPHWVEKIRRGEIGAITPLTPAAYDELVL
jgi:2,4-dienoyl-CoA reductase-like NADH-dependent reductase (Old Yellow Enzyme family)